ncbi:MAG: bifunctional diguanylate cyclase/phosphodiesterase [Chromatiales bacterium]|nr:bifunctional diguanylate cyclase/phosphodiesterase [Chromatiales bacterium]
MNVRFLMLFAFSAVIAITVTVFALVTYNLTFDIAVNQQGELLKRLTTEEAERLATLIPNDRRKFAWGSLIGYEEGESYVDIIIDQKGVVASGLPLDEIEQRFAISPERLTSLFSTREQYGHFVENGALYLWAGAEMPGTGLSFYNIQFNMADISNALSTLTTRLFIWSAVLIWVSSWVVLIVASIISHRIKKKNEVIEFKSLHDELTGLGNRNLLQSELVRLVESDKLQSRRMALMIVDVTRFKEINNTLGHKAGDYILKEVANRLLKTLRSSDTTTRFGSDEFAVIAMVDDDVAAEGVATKIRAAFIDPFEIDGQEIKIDLSIGAALYPKHGIDAPTLIRHAEVAIQSAKTSTQLLTFYNPTRDHHSKRKLELLHQFSTALSSGEMRLHFQPKFNLATSEFDSVEALLRWYHPTKGVLYPAEILPLAVQMTMMPQLTRWVVGAALSFAQYQARQGRSVNVAINLAATDLEDDALPDVMRGMFAQYGVEPQQLTIEISESVIVKSGKTAVEMLEKMAEMGVVVSIDDFGSAYVSQTFLSRLPISEVKIDSSLVNNMYLGNNESTLRGIVELAHSISCRVVAKGVENPKVLVPLRDLGCDVLQGYFLSHPMESHDFDSWVDNRSDAIVKLALA